jgi:hypothetical protein
MTFAVPAKEETPQSVLEKQLEMGGRLMLTIPFGVPTEEMQGFVSVMGSKEIYQPVMTICVAKPTGGSIVSTIVFDSTERFTEFIDKIHMDRMMYFEADNLAIAIDN